MRLALFFALTAVLIMALLPMRMKVLSDYGHPYAAEEEEFYFSSLAELADLKAKGAEEETVQRCKIKVAKALTILRKYLAADNIFREVVQARSKSTLPYDQTFVSAMIAWAGLRRDMGDMKNSVKMYYGTLEYDKKHLLSKDPRISRDKANLAVALLISGTSSKSADLKKQFLKAAAGYLLEAIDEQKERAPQGSLSEANLRQNLAYALEGMADRAGYEKELQNAREMQLRFAKHLRPKEP